MKPMLLGIDQGTTSSRAVLFGVDGGPCAMAQHDYPQIYPHPAWVEQDPEAIWNTTLAAVKQVLDAGLPKAIGIANQRETVVIWDRATGNPIYNAIVWQDRRTADACEALRAGGADRDVQNKTGLVLDPYFSATKIAWILDQVPDARVRAERGELAAGTIDCFLLWRLTGGRVHATDWTNASRTLLYDIGRQAWDEELLRLFRVPVALLPDVFPNAHLFGETDPAVVGHRLPIAGMVGDQQAALVGQACFAPGDAKATYGTGCFMLMNVGSEPVVSSHRLLATPAYEVGGQRAYALEGSIFIAGAGVKWLRDRLGLFVNAGDTEALAAAANPDHGVTIVPAFVGLGAPHWRADVRGSITGLTLDTGKPELVRAMLEAIAAQTDDLMDAMALDCGVSLQELRIDGGMAANGWFAQHLADRLGIRVERSAHHELTAWGAAALAGLSVGLYPDLASIAARNLDRTQFAPAMGAAERADWRANWQKALARALARD